ncbi:hypothetical protein [Bradyrhizobium guangzhouense]|uniref:Uncharacterized protein n=1 Tax=Bradyrhizobium guangzhouense TaxID=1325095 RepID=A0AAE5WWZ1_9BRAD|nr:hypothetical protein [Bradyrhizobium guangzhouense]QAU44435.1 hypothetical protein XH91_03075 [Bradyrhizobium guangzhouense]RXH09996.1 hypothetical protein EAS56_23905 [Bradyrhizobium guangzhouense]
MAKQTREQRIELARTRLIRVVSSHSVATMRTLEMKISDAGPFNQRIDPHILTEARNQLLAESILQRRQPGVGKPTYFFLGNTAWEGHADRYAVLDAIQTELAQQAVTMRTGQALEIAVFRTMTAAQQNFFGRFLDLTKHGDDQLYRKVEPPNYIGDNVMPDDRLLDFMVCHGGVWAGIECKNVREWLYPDRREVKDLLDKAVALNCVPVLIARRIHPSTFLLFNKCGIIIHQTYNQRLANADADLAARARAKDTLGYFDMKLGNDPDDRLTKFLTINLPAVLPEARQKFEEYYDLLWEYAFNGMSYEAFAARVRRRYNGGPEDFDPD